MPSIRIEAYIDATKVDRWTLGETLSKLELFMQNITFFGRVHPERAAVYLGSTITLPGAKSRDGSAEFDSAVSIRDGQIAVRITNIRGIHDLAVLRNSVTNIVQAIVDTIGYRNGCGYEVELTSSMSDDGQAELFGVKALESNIPEGAASLDFSNAALLALKHIYLRRALRELRLAVRLPEDSAFHCRRAVEAISKHFAEMDGAPNEWDAMNDALNVDPGVSRALSKAAGEIRHGAMEDTTTERRTELLTNAWSVVDRFILFLANGEAVLDKTNYALLK